jgi:hypothetical protein
LENKSFGLRNTKKKKTEGEAEKEILKIGGDDIFSATKICCFVAFKEKLSLLILY